MSRSDLSVRIGTDLSNLNKGLDGALKGLKRFGFKAESIGRDLTTRISLPLIALGGVAVKTFAEFDRLEKGLSALNGSAEGGAKSFNRLNAIVLDTRTTLDLKTAALGAQRLQGAGLSAAFAERTIKQLGIAATVSGSSIDDVGGVLRQFTQIIGKGKIEQEDMNSILDRMPAIGALIKEEFGGVTAEAIRDTGISMEEFVSRTVKAIETNESFQNVQGGLAKSFESFANAVQVGIRPLGETIAKVLNLEQNLQRLGDFVTNASKAFADLNPNVQKFIIYTALAAAAVGPLTFGLGAAAKSLPLLISGFKLLSGPLGKVGGLLGVVFSAFAQLGSGSIIQRVLGFIGVFIKSITSLTTVMAVLTSPITLIIAAIALITIAFIKAYKNSGFFRLQLDRVAQALYPITESIKNLVQKILPDFSFSLSGLGEVFNAVFAVIAGGISFVVEGFIAIIDTIKLVAGAASDIFAGEFKAANNKLSKSLFNPAVVARTAADAAKAAATVFSQTLAGEDTSTALGSKGSGPRSTATPGGDGTELLGLGGGSGGGNRNTANAIEAIDFGAVTELSSKARKEIGAFFNEFVVGGTNVEFLQSKFDGLEIKQIKGLDRVTRMQEVFEELGKELTDGLGTAFEEVNKKAKFFGDGFDPLAAKISLANEALAQAYEQDLPATSEAVTALKNDIAELTIKQEEQSESQKRGNEKLAITKSFYESLGITFNKVFEAFTSGQKSLALGIAAVAGVAESAFDSMASGAVSFGAALARATRSIIGSFIKQGVAAVVSGALTNAAFLGPLAIPIGAAAGAGANALFQGLLTSLNIPALADGGITTGAQIALIGEAGPEAVVPLPTLDALIQRAGGGGGGGGQVEFILSGENLRGLLNQSNSSFNRSF
jgi:tape measure domain-containing protein